MRELLIGYIMSAAIGGSNSVISPSITGPCSSGVAPVPVVSSALTTCNEGAAARRRTLAVAVACLLQEAGCAVAEKAVLGTLVEMLQSTIVELGRTARGYCELACRTEPLGADIILALADMGINYDGLQAYCRRQGRSIVPSLQVQQDTKHHTILQVGDKKPHLPYIPENLPQFPDTHTYCFTPTVKQPVTEYEAIREKAATQKRDIERALTKFATKTNPTESLFIADDKEFALVCVAPTATQNIDALMPRDQVFEAELDYEVSKARKKRQDRLTSFQQQQQQLKQEQGGDFETEIKMPDIIDTDSTDNPYLRPVKMPRKVAGRVGKQLPPRTVIHTPPKDSILGPNISKIVLGAAVNPSSLDPTATFGDSVNLRQEGDISAQSDNLDVLSDRGDDDNNMDDFGVPDPMAAAAANHVIGGLEESIQQPDYREDEGDYIPLGSDDQNISFQQQTSDYANMAATSIPGIDHDLTGGGAQRDELLMSQLRIEGRQENHDTVMSQQSISSTPLASSRAMFLRNPSGEMSFMDQEEDDGEVISPEARERMAHFGNGSELN